MDAFLKQLEYHYEVIDLITFAWEKENETESSSILPDRRSIPEKVIEGIEILVIIGYSFPYFNREIDNELFKAMKIEGLKKIYYQDPFNDGKFLRNQFDLASNFEIDHINKVDNFFLPLEL